MMISREALEKELRRLEKLGKSVMNNDFDPSVPWKCPCCGANYILVGAVMRRKKRGPWRHKHRIYNIDKGKFDGPWS